MHISWLPLFKPTACLAVLAFLVGATTAGAAEKTPKNPVKLESIFAGPHTGSPLFFTDLNTVSCSSSCCSAYASCNGPAFVSCTATACIARCPDSGVTSTHLCGDSR